MKKQIQYAGIAAAGLLTICLCVPEKTAAQDPILTPILVDTATSIVVSALKPKPTGLVKFQGYVMHANNAQLTVRAKNNDMAVQTFALTGDAATKMNQLIEKGGFQYGDRITVYYNPQTLQAVKFKGKPSSTL